MGKGTTNILGDRCWEELQGSISELCEMDLNIPWLVNPFNHRETFLLFQAWRIQVCCGFQSDFLKINLFILFIFYFWLCCIFVAACGLSLVAVSGGYSSSRCVGFSLWWLLLLQSTGSRHAGFNSCGRWASAVVARRLWSTGSVVVAHGLSCSAACGIFPDQGSNPCLLHWQADS